MIVSFALVFLIRICISVLFNVFVKFVIYNCKYLQDVSGIVDDVWYSNICFIAG